MLGRILRGGTAAAALLVATSVATPTAWATTFAPMTIEQFTDASTWIVEGRVDRVWTEVDPESGLVWTRSEITLSVVHKGASTPASLVVDSLGGRHGDLEVHVAGQAVFSPGEDVMLFLDDLGDRLVPISKFLGKYTVRRANGEERSHVMTWHPRRGEIFDHRFLPHPSVEHRVYLDDLRDQVRARLDVGWTGQVIPGITAERLGEINTEARRMRR